MPKNIIRFGGVKELEAEANRWNPADSRNGKAMVAVLLLKKVLRFIGISVSVRLAKLPELKPFFQTHLKIFTWCLIWALKLGSKGSRCPNTPLHNLGSQGQLRRLEPSKCRDRCTKDGSENAALQQQRLTLRIQYDYQIDPPDAHYKTAAVICRLKECNRRKNHLDPTLRQICNLGFNAHFLGG